MGSLESSDTIDIAWTKILVALREIYLAYIDCMHYMSHEVQDLYCLK